MLDFTLPSEFAEIQRDLRRLLAAEFAPVLHELAVSESGQGDAALARWYRRLGGLGYLDAGLSLVGGPDDQEAALLLAALVWEAYGEAGAGLGYALCEHAAGSLLLGQMQEPALLEAAVSGEAVTACIGLAGGHALPEATRRESGEYAVSGRAAAVANASLADLFLVAARDRETNAPVAVLLKRGAPGLAIGPSPGWPGFTAAGLADVSLDGATGKGVPLSPPFFGGLRDSLRPLLLSAALLGAAGSACAAARAYAGTRVQFGRRIGEFQGIQFKLADMATNLEAARWMVYRLAWDRNAGGGSASATRADTVLALALKTALESTREALQIHGGNGMMREYPVSRWHREVVTAGALEHPRGYGFPLLGAALESDPPAVPW